MNRLQFGPLAMLDQANGKSPVDSVETQSEEKKSNEQHLAVETESAVDRSRRRHSDDESGLFPAVTDPQANANTRSFLDSMNIKSALVHSNLFIPMHYEKNYSYPLVVFLHDHNQNESQLQRIMPDIDCRNYVAISLRSWGKINSEDAWPQTDESIEHAHASLTKSIAQATAKLNINPAKIFLVGSGAGATMALRLAFEFHGELAGVAALNGALPNEGTPLCRLTDARAVPVYWAHYRNSQSFPEDDLCQGVSLLHTAGFNLTMRQYPVDENGCRQVFSDLNQWLMESVTA